MTFCILINIFPNKSLGIHVLDVSQWFSFNPLGEVICADQQIPLIHCGLRKKDLQYPSPIERMVKGWTKD